MNSQKNATLGRPLFYIYRILPRDMRNIYETAAPIPGETPSSDANQFLDIVRDLFREAVKTAGGEVIG